MSIISLGTEKMKNNIETIVHKLFYVWSNILNPFQKRISQLAITAYVIVITNVIKKKIFLFLTVDWNILP